MQIVMRIPIVLSLAASAVMAQDPFGDSMAITIKDASTWAITYKRGDRVTIDTIWKVANDGRVTPS